MTLDEAIATLSRGCCTREAAKENGCTLCVPRYAAMDWVREQLELSDRALSERDDVRRFLEELAADNKCMRAELEEISRIAEPGKAWPYERAMRALGRTG